MNEEERTVNRKITRSRIKSWIRAELVSKTKKGRTRKGARTFWYSTSLLRPEKQGSEKARGIFVCLLALPFAVLFSRKEGKQIKHKSIGHLHQIAQVQQPNKYSGANTFFFYNNSQKLHNKINSVEQT